MGVRFASGGVVVDDGLGGGIRGTSPEKVNVRWQRGQFR